jgi:hypothetical protein
MTDFEDQAELLHQLRSPDVAGMHWTDTSGWVCLVQVHGSVEDERMFSSLMYLKTKYRNRLQEEHLNVAARFFKLDCFKLSDFPYDEALEVWHAGAEKRGRYSKP